MNVWIEEVLQGLRKNLWFQLSRLELPTLDLQTGIIKHDTALATMQFVAR